MTTTMNTLSPTEVKFTLSTIGYQREFVVIFLKTDGTQRKMRCMMEAPKNPSKGDGTVVPVMDLDVGQWRSFRTDKVLYIG